MSDWVITLAITVAIIVISAFFVILEFALLAARRHRLEESAEHSRSARAALRGLNELTVMLAGAQLGITACTFALGAVSKPAVHYALTPVFESWSLPYWAADALAFALALLLMTFLHLVVGEMAPKSWAIAHPERAVKLVALPAQIILWGFRPLLLWINHIANRLVSATGITPVDRAAAGGYDSETIRHLVEHSTRTGTLDEASASQISRVIDLETLTVDDVIAARTRQETTTVPASATAADVQAAARRTGHLRVLIIPETGADPLVVHVRDTLTVDAEHPVSDLARPALVVSTGASVYEAFQTMREAGEQLAVVYSDTGLAGAITWNDILKRMWPTMEEQWSGSSAAERRPQGSAPRR
ncbi:CNNM domain-containing protein [Nesterenkonia lutea]|uniref:CBS domain containing-hemolysin-like protein n=1 Tax=Nesterenkonia lutea TaxID=272919 RepID=A0ABR9JGZ8_9MICC|nr:hemolysin family protein [Nesterenkonia lutea]MBE1525202.1 CBS domain containing-hemolysin-like protein [Nesterenkonia lutea]